MDLSKIKNLVKQNGDKFIFVENGEPEVVMMSFREYEKFVGGVHSASHDILPPSGGTKAMFPEDDEDSEEEMQKGFPPVVISESMGLPVRLEDIRLEDLPL